MTDLNITNTFVSGTSIVAADMNQNFDDIETLVNTTGVPKIQDGVVSTTAKIADGVVTEAKIAADAFAQWRTVIERSTWHNLAPNTSAYAMIPAVNLSGSVSSTANTSDSHAKAGLFYFDPAAYDTAGKTLYARVVAEGHSTSSGSGTNTCTVQMHSLTTLHASGYISSSSAVGNSVVLSCAAGATSATSGISTAFDASAFSAGFYYFNYACSSANIGASFTLHARLEVRVQ